MHQNHQHGQDVDDSEDNYGGGIKFHGWFLKFIAKAGYDPVYGARPLKRYLQRELETRIARAIIGGTVIEGGTLTVELENGVLCVK